jgi:hypothetical protein
VALPGSVPPGATVDLAVRIKTPVIPGAYRGDWNLGDKNGAWLGLGASGDGSLYVLISVIQSAVPIPPVVARIVFSL